MHYNQYYQSQQPYQSNSYYQPYPYYQSQPNYDYYRTMSHHMHPDSVKNFLFKSVEMRLTTGEKVRGYIYNVDKTTETAYYATCEHGKPTGNAIDTKYIMTIKEI